MTNNIIRRHKISKIFPEIIVFQYEYDIINYIESVLDNTKSFLSVQDFVYYTEYLNKDDSYCILQVNYVFGNITIKLKTIREILKLSNNKYEYQDAIDLFVYIAKNKQFIKKDFKYKMCNFI